jgi:hypothetical protein
MNTQSYTVLSLTCSLFRVQCSGVRANQSLKLTEPAVDDFAARCWKDLGAFDRNVRATNYLAAAIRRRSLAPVR